MASPFKIKLEPQEPLTGRDIKNIIEHNNFTNQNLKTIGDQLVWIENLFQNEKEDKQAEEDPMYIYIYRIRGTNSKSKWILI